MEDLIKALKAISDETRLRMMNILLERECCVCEVMQALNISETRASRNLNILQESGFLKARRDGTWVMYSIDRETPNEYAASLVKLLKASRVSSDVLYEDRKRFKKAVKVGPGC